MELLQLRYFQTVARFENITKAAEYHHIPQPAMSQTISRLERELGDIRLFDRQNNRIRLNDDGRRFLEYVNKALTALDDGVRELSCHQDTVSGPICLLVLENRRFALQCASVFAKTYPDVTFSISHEFTPDISRSYDLCICSSPTFAQMSGGIPLIRERLILNVNELHPMAQRKEVRLHEVANEKFITMTSHSSMYQLTIDSCRKCGFEPRTPFICDDPYYVRKYVSENMGIALAPAISWAGRFRSNTRLVEVVDPAFECTSYLLWDEGRYHTPAVRAFRDYMLQEALSLPGNMLVPDLGDTIRTSEA